MVAGFISVRTTIGMHRVQPHRLLEHRLQPAVVARGGGLAGPGAAGSRVAAQLVERPGQRGRGRLVAGEQQGDQLVAELGVGERVAASVGHADQPGQHVGALVRGRGRYGARGSRRRSAASSA